MWKFIYSKILSSQKVILLVVLQSEGSSPGRQGFKMVISEDGGFYGTIGGGIMEHKLVEWAKDLLTKAWIKPFVKHQIHRQEAEKDKSGMICSGSQTVAFYYLDRDNIEVIKNNFSQDWTSVKFTEMGIEVGDEIKSGYYSEIFSDQQWIMIEPLNLPNQVYIIGGGHVGLALSDILSKLDFEIHLLDHRRDLNTMEMNRFVHTKQVIDFQEIDKYIPEGDQVYVVIMSFGYRTDKIALKALLGRNYKFIGMMGSKKKTEVLMAELLKEGHTSTELEKVKAPIGLDIKSETTYEIAISVAAQLIQFKNRQNE